MQTAANRISPEGSKILYSSGIASKNLLQDTNIILTKSSASGAALKIQQKVFRVTFIEDPQQRETKVMMIVDDK